MGVSAYLSGSLNLQELLLSELSLFVEGEDELAEELDQTTQELEELRAQLNSISERPAQVAFDDDEDEIDSSGEGGDKICEECAEDGSGEICTHCGGKMVDL